MKLLSAKYSQKQFSRTNTRLQRGQGMVEYITSADYRDLLGWGKSMLL